MVSQLQGVVASIEAPSEDYTAELRDQMTPDPGAVNKLRAKLQQLKGELAGVDTSTTGTAEASQRAANEKAASERAAARREVEEKIRD
eukprot:1595147-Prymnesium_polylepis.1